MNANELRIGNLVMMGTRTIVQINQLRGSEVFTNTKVALIESAINDIKPIPLTPEILEKCGFEAPDYRFPNHSFYSLQNWLEVSGEVRQSIWLLYANDDEYRTGTEFQYLHQLQNLYFALTGTELTVNL
jgi:hypothetical protein